ncbi:hypothetical protein M0R45_000390 [Rubus argutus]|uniref:Uncharacterized protein n=1 Tax=Rubus argutus TaxID=59490 RepID=A0AAW1VR64_RUBAR
MALRVHLLPPKTLNNLQNSTPIPSLHNPFHQQTQNPIYPIHQERISDAQLASDLSKMNTLFAQREEAHEQEQRASLHRAVPIPGIQKQRR